MCTCQNQLQPHDPMPRACPADAVLAKYGTFEQPNGSAMLADLRALTTVDGEAHPYADEMTLGGEA